MVAISLPIDPSENRPGWRTEYQSHNQVFVFAYNYILKGHWRVEHFTVADTLIARNGPELWPEIWEEMDKIELLVAWAGGSPDV
jgi:hypothetical protein